MVKLTFDNLVPSTPPTDGWRVRYRILGSGGAYTSVGPYTSFPFDINIADPAGTLYEGFIRRDCGATESTETPFETDCECAATYVQSANGLYCQKTESIPANVTSSNYCFATSQNGVYSTYGTRVYKTTFTNTDIQLPIGTPPGGNIEAILTTAGQWQNNTSSAILGPMNRDSVWIDTNCDGVVDPPVGGTMVTLAFNYNNTGVARQVYVGIAADNDFTLNINGVEIAKTAYLSTDSPFKIWHMIPFTLLVGMNYFNMVATGDGSTNDAIAMVVYDNTLAEITAAVADSSLTRLFKSQDVRNTHLDIATCDTGYSLDTSGGVGNYVCRRVLTKVCNSADI